MGRHFFILLFFIGAIALGCNDFGRLQKSNDLNLKYSKAVEYYGKGDYVKAQLLFDELYAVFRNTNRADSVAYLLAYTNYQLGDYIMAGYLFRSYFRTYPTSPRAAECLYMSAYCHYLISPPWSLDQEDTYYAIEEFQYFIQMFPTDTARIRECNKMVDVLHEKLEKKAFMNARMYFRIADYKASITAFELLLNDFPDTHYREEATYYILRSKYYLAQNSIAAKKEERVVAAISAARTFLATYKESEWTDEVNETLNMGLKLQEELEKDKKTNSPN